MFVYYYATLAAPFATVETRLLDALNGLGDLADAAYRDGEEIHCRMGGGIDRHLIAKTVRLDAGTPRRFEQDTTIPLVWEATGARILFPRMEGDLIVAALGSELTQLTFRGSYEPPLGALGRAIDRTLLHRIAEASVQGFVERIAAALTVEKAGAAAPAAAYPLVVKED